MTNPKSCFQRMNRVSLLNIFGSEYVKELNGERDTFTIKAPEYVCHPLQRLRPQHGARDAMIKIKNLLIAAALVIASPALVFSQDIFLSFDSDSFLNTDTQDSGTGSAFLFSDGQFAFDALDLNFLTSDSSVLRFTGGEAFNPTFDIIGGTRFTSSEITVDPTTNTGNLFSVNIVDNGVNPALGPLFDPGFNADVGPNGAVLLARLDFDIGGSGHH